MKIQVLGSGCANCKKAAEIMIKAADYLGLVSGKDYQLEKIEEIKEIMKFGITMTPGIAIDGKVVSFGKVPSMADATTFLTNKLSENQS
jgi:small redox-active disulfide protein 2